MIKVWCIINSEGSLEYNHEDVYAPYQVYSDEHIAKYYCHPENGEVVQEMQLNSLELTNQTH